MHVTNIHAYHKLITDSYDQRSRNYNDSEWHRALARQLVDYNPPPKHGNVLDIGTGTGAVAFHAASIVGAEGEIIGVDISEGMIAKARELLQESAFRNIEFVLADGENLAFSRNRFDRVYCASAFFWMSDKVEALKHWRELLKPGGNVGFHAWPENSYVWGYVARQVLKRYGVEYLAHAPNGSIETCTRMLEQAGYKHIDIKVVESGHYISLEEALNAWISEEHYPVGQYPHPVSITPPDILEQARKDYEAEITRLNTDKGVWNDTTIYYVFGQKPNDAR